MRAKLSRHQQAPRSPGNNNYFLTTASAGTRIVFRFRSDSGAVRKSSSRKFDRTRAAAQTRPSADPNARSGYNHP